MLLAFSLEGFGIITLGHFGSNPYAFLLLSSVVLAWGEIYSLIAAHEGDAFGAKHIGEICGVLYCAKGLGALFVSFGNLLMEETGSWLSVLYAVASMDILAAVLAIAVLRPLYAVHVRNSSLEEPSAGTAQSALVGA